MLGLPAGDATDDGEGLFAEGGGSCDMLPALFPKEPVPACPSPPSTAGTMFAHWHYRGLISSASILRRPSSRASSKTFIFASGARMILSKLANKCSG